MPPRFHYRPERLQRIINQLDSDIQNVVDFRHESWLDKDVCDAYIGNKLIFAALISHRCLRIKSRLLRLLFFKLPYLRAAIPA
ncbi:MAG: hypothetical protein ACYC43_08175 [Burkholderiales bacterium]